MEQPDGRFPESETRDPIMETVQVVGFIERFYADFPELTAVFDDRFKENLTEYWRSTVRDEFDEPLSPEEEAVALDKALHREMAFFAKVYSAGMAMSSHFPGKVTMLFDIDNTLREPGADMVRPAFTLAINLLDQELGERLEVGLLTTIPLVALDTKLGGPGYLESVRSKLNTEYFICSGEYELGGADASPLDGWANKTKIVKDLAAKHTDRAFVLVDDLKSTDEGLHDNPRVLGVAVTTEIHNDLWRQAAMAS